MNSCAHPSPSTGQLILCHGFRYYGLALLVHFQCFFHWFLYGPAHTQSKQSISKAYHTHWWTHGFRYNGSELLVPFHCISIDFSMAHPIQNRSRAWAKAYQNNWQTHVPIQVHRCCIGSFIVCHCFRYYGLALLVLFHAFSLLSLWPRQYKIV